ncbi:MAG: hypothetical protein JJLCMIEE_01575 [Acidimicrobiales bacterium]|nr:hypothetical protein [Acidimicrobiales bacterium]
MLIAAFEGWNDAGEAATTAIRFLKDRWHHEDFATIDPEDFYDFTTTRPLVTIDDESVREVVWPGNVFSAVTHPERSLDLIVLDGVEPQLRWRTYCDQVIDIARAYGVRLVLTLGALLADVAHTRPVSVFGTAYDDQVIEALDLEPSRYEGPTGIVGVLHSACRAADINSASLWAAVPTYVSGAPSPKGALALVERTTQMLDLPVSTTELTIAATSYERQVSELVADDEDTLAYVRRLEEQYDRNEHSVGSADDLVEEVERFLRDQ